MRQLVHTVLGMAFWVVLAACWLVLALQHQATLTALEGTLLRLAVLSGAVLAITLSWVRYNVATHRRKGARSERPAHEPRTDRDRLGRRLVWDTVGGTAAARVRGRLVVELDGGAKVYR